MNEHINVILATEVDGKVRGAPTSIPVPQLPDNDVLVQIDWSTRTPRSF